jgi:hypothetical protein
MRETRLSGSEGGGARTRSPYPYLQWAPSERLFVRANQGKECRHEFGGQVPGGDP